MDLPVGDVLSLIEGAYLAQDGFEETLRAVFPALSVTHDAGPVAIDDPFFWSLGGRFGAHPPGSDPGTIFRCARYGLGTLDWFAEHGFSTPKSFALMGVALPLYDDAALWPEGAVARLHCSFIWDDARVVSILRPDTAREALAGMFMEVVDATANAPAALLGAEVFALEAHGGPSDTVVQGRTAAITLTQGHQQVSFRSFLMGGGV